jgi:hypothetical protein
VRARDRGVAVEVGDRAGDAKDSMKASRRPAESRRHALQQVRRRVVEAAMPIERLAGELAVGAALAIDGALARLANRPATTALAAPSAAAASYAAATAGTSIWMSMRSSSGPLIFPW